MLMHPNIMKTQPPIAPSSVFERKLIRSVNAWLVTTPADMPELVMISAKYSHGITPMPSSKKNTKPTQK